MKYFNYKVGILLEYTNISIYYVPLFCCSIVYRVYLFQAERDLRIAQSEFDRQAEITKLLLEGVSSSHAAHLRCLMEFVDTQARYYSQCSTIMAELQKELSR